MNQELLDTPAAQLHSVETVMSRLAIGRSRVFELIRIGQLRSVKVGRRRLVSESAIREFIARLDDAGDPSVA